MNQRVPDNGVRFDVSERRPGIAEIVVSGDPGQLTSADLAERLQRTVHASLGSTDGRSRVPIHRIELTAEVTDRALWRAATRIGFRQEGVLRGAFEGRDGVLLARLADDPATDGPEGFTHVLNSTLPRKRLIAQGLVRDGQGRILLCELTYKRFWDLPGGVVDPDEPPATTVRREIAEELALDAPVGRLAAVSWLPRWLGWDDATLFVFEASLPEGTEQADLLPREIKAVHWVSLDELDNHVAPYTAAVTREAIRALDEGTGCAYLENGTPVTTQEIQ